MVRNSSLAPTRIWRTPQDLLRLAQRLTGGKRDFEFDYAQLTDANSQVVEDRLGCLLSQLQTAGIALIKGVPIDTTTGEKSAKAIKEVASWIGPIRHTFYGETWDVINLGKDSKNVAYTNHNLGLHMDLMYFENPPRFQLLHCLRNQVEGGASYFVDSFAVRSRMHKEFPTLHQALSKNRIPFKYKNDGHSLLTNRAIFERSTHGGWTTVAWSPPFQGVTGSPNERVQRDISAKWSDRNQDFLEGVAKFEELINDSAARYQFTMKAGDLVLFDNRRILHARQAFTEYSAEKKKEMGIVDGEVNRWLKGCYIDGDAVWDKLAVLRAKYGKRQKWDWTGDKIAA
ncbi:taurine catabolism dioxygenase TauD, TfdA family-domain-containing protein [Kockovaella imperatae]|uniref:Taurine catabolism dioxygenase TauD, TfdA family-domain-containing protein n=1 Tax=Kockovaella imperatae TaxID=4999 RepID=A0A1Y1UBS4_9TREE|nr:taurine catabolism dioxygenase TauD, TfdA family-domain-containing protein [Kockovaella imperatae]ORX34984.1 taurine catabolism dioxygenase TauD, TfdA family-domain-containing protein [Kockovaella imperatae]